MNSNDRAALIEVIGHLSAAIDTGNNDVSFHIDKGRAEEIKDAIRPWVESWVLPQLLFIASGDEKVRTNLDIRKSYEWVREGDAEHTEYRWVQAARAEVARYENHPKDVRVGHARAYLSGPVEWLQVIHKINDLEPDTFQEPEIGRTGGGEYVEHYPRFDLVLHDEGKGDATFQPLSEHALDLLEKALQETGVTVVSRS